MRNRLGGCPSMRRFLWLLAALLIFAVSSNASDGQKQKKKNNKDADQPSQPMPTTPDLDQIDHDIGEMLAAFQLGKVDLMHKYYSDNVTVVSGEYEPPIVGWNAYAPLYQRQWAAFQGMQLNRRNTIIFTHGDVAWAAYQWQFDSLLNGQPYSLRGQTTLIFNKVGDNWLIVHNHTSQIYPAQTQQPAVPEGSRP
jgi:ketosteroid isomerase-like protein